MWNTIQMIVSHQTEWVELYRYLAVQELAGKLQFTPCHGGFTVYFYKSS